MEQKVKITNPDSGTSVYFFDHNFKTAYQHADDYISRNSGKFKMKRYHKNNSQFGPLWIETH